MYPWQIVPVGMAVLVAGKMGRTMLINGDFFDSRTRIDLTPGTSYQRLLVHRCSAYHKLAPETDSITKTIIVVATPESRM